MGSQLEGVWRENSHSKEPQEYETTDRWVLHMRIRCGETHRERLLVITEYLAPPSGESTQSFRNVYRGRQREVIKNFAGQNTCVHPAQVNDSESVSVCMCCLTWKAFRRQLSEWPEDVTHEGRTAGAGLCYKCKNLLYITLKILLSTHKHMHMRCRKIPCTLEDIFLSIVLYITSNL